MSFISQCFWSDIKNGVSLNIKDVPSFELCHIIFHMDGLAFYILDIIHIILLLGTAQIGETVSPPSLDLLLILRFSPHVSNKFK